jgi:hypothetical protein
LPEVNQWLVPGDFDIPAMEFTGRMRYTDLMPVN